MFLIFPFYLHNQDKGSNNDQKEKLYCWVGRNSLLIIRLRYCGLLLCTSAFTWLFLCLTAARKQTKYRGNGEVWIRASLSLSLFYSGSRSVSMSGSRLQTKMSFPLVSANNRRSFLTLCAEHDREPIRHARMLAKANTSKKTNK